MQLNEHQRDEAVALIESLPWGDLAYRIPGFHAFLGHALRATSIALERRGIEMLDPSDSYPLTDAEVSGLSDLDHDAYIARLVSDLVQDWPMADLDYPFDPNYRAIDTLVLGLHSIVVGDSPIDPDA